MTTISLNVFFFFLCCISIIVAVPLPVNPRSTEVELFHDEVLTLKLMLLIDNVLPGEENIEIQNAHEFIEDVNEFTSGLGRLGTHRFRLNLVQVETMPGNFSTFQDTHKDNEIWRDLYMQKYSSTSDIGMLISKSNASDYGGYAQFTLCDDIAPAGLVTTFTWDRREERVNTFVHELGHMLGLRHDEEAMCDEIGLMSKDIHFEYPQGFSHCNVQQFQDRLHYLKSCIPSAFASSSSSSRMGRAVNNDEVSSTESISNPTSSSSSSSSEPWYRRIPFQVFSAGRNDNNNKNKNSIPKKEDTPIVTSSPQSSKVPSIGPLPKAEVPRSQASELQVAPGGESRESTQDISEFPSPLAYTFTPDYDHSSSSQPQSSRRNARNEIVKEEEVQEGMEVQATSTAHQNPMVVSALTVAHSIVNNPIVQLAVTAGLSSQAPDLLPVIRNGLEMARPTVEDILRENNVPLEPSTQSPISSSTSSTQDRVDDQVTSPSTFPHINISEMHQKVGKFIHDLFNSFLQSFSNDRSSSK